MAQSLTNAFVDTAAVNARTAEETNPDANWNNGMNVGASNACGIGISTENPNLEESLFAATDGSGDLVTGSWTLLDQHGNARAAQISQLLGGPGFVSRVGDQEFTWDTTQPLYTDSGAASSGGQEGTLPDSVVRLGSNPTQTAKDGDPALDGTLILAGNATLVDLTIGWALPVPP
jgi:hypothetical protein